MKFRVSKNTLFLTASIVWIIAGFNILRIGITTWFQDTTTWQFKLLETILVFLFFFGFIFNRLYKKYANQISQREGEKHCPFSFFDKKGWLMMAFMIGLGIVLRHSQLLPISFFSFFYSGLGTALLLTGLRFLFFQVKSR